MSELIIASTSSTDIARTQTFNLLEMTDKKGVKCESSFGNNFYPIIGINTNGKVDVVCEDDSIKENIRLLIIPDNKEFEDKFTTYIKNQISSLESIYALLHDGDGSKATEQKKKLFEIAIGNEFKLKIITGHHTPSDNGNPQHRLGDGLEIVAEAVLDEIPDRKKFKEGIEYLKRFNPYLRDLIRLHKLLVLKKIRQPDFNLNCKYEDLKNENDLNEVIKSIPIWFLNNLDNNIPDYISNQVIEYGA